MCEMIIYNQINDTSLEREIIMRIGTNIRIARLNKGLSQNELGKLSSVPQTTISDWENSKSIPNIEAVERIAKVLDVSISDLMK